MGKDKKDKKKGQTMTLSDFVGPSGGTQAQEDDMSWALDGKQWEAEGEGEATPGQPRKIFARTAGSMNNFREGGAVQGARVVDFNMEKPYLGFVANLLTNLPEEEVRNFFTDASLKIENIKMIYKDRSTFAFVEFDTPQSLQLALLLEGKFLKNRPVKVDIATQDQREKMMNDKARGMVGAGGAKSPNAPFPDRDAMGSEQRSFNSMGERNARSTTSANAPRDFGDFSRDTMGGAQPELSTEGFRNLGRTPNSSAPSGGSFPNFRDSEKVEQPRMEQPRMPRQSSKESVGGKDKEGGSWRAGSSKVASPTTKTEGSNWRDSAKVEQPVGSWRDQPATEQPNQITAIERRPKKDDTAPKKEEQPAAPKATPGAKTLQIGGETQPQPKKTAVAPPVAAAPPKVSAWGNSGGLAALRNKD